MKRLLILLLLLAIIPLASAKTYNENSTLRIEGQEFTIASVSSGHQAVFFENEHGDFAISEGDCKDRDIYLLCVENINYSPVEFWPHEYEIDFTWEKICTDCFAWGQQCKNNSERVCQDDCVHGICRPDSPWCGDGYCDAGEDYLTCDADCDKPAVNETNTTSNESVVESNQTSEEQASTNESQNTSTSQPEQNSTPSGPAAETVEDNPNWLGGAITIFGGIVLIFVIFNRKKKDEDDLYSYK